ncbi:MAG: adenosylcobalamin-dependent ribonucleoside-diphosphate reductase [Bacillota bacterium]
MEQRIQQLLKDRYLLDGEEDWQDISRRVADVVSEAEIDSVLWYEEFEAMLTNMDFIPNSPCLMNAGTEEQYMSACNVLPVDDSMDSIFEAIKELALVNKAGSGTGFAFSRLRESGARVGDIDGVSSGPMSFMKVFDRATDIVKQGGRRKGANMGVLRVDHPDIVDFVTSKGELNDKNKQIYESMKSQLNKKEAEVLKNTLLEKQLTNFNISVGITDDFMDAVMNEEEFDLISPKDNSVVDTVSAVGLFDLIVEYAHKNGEPGLIFLDTINEKHPINERIEGVNVCGEQPLLPYESCILGAINLANMLRAVDFVDNKPINYEVAWDYLETIVENAVRFLDDVIDMNDYPLPELEEKALEYRKIGIGVMGFHEMLMYLDIPYDTKKARDLAEELSEFINDTAINYSEKLAEEKGEFPGFDNTDIRTPRRNAVLTTVAPTGSRALIANTSYGIEPFFSLKYTHTDGDGNKTQLEYDFTKVASKDTLRTALNIDPIDHLLMQAAWQKNVGSAVSKTINLPENATKDDVSFIYKEAFMRQLKGITIYRNGSRQVQVLNEEDENEDKKLIEAYTEAYIKTKGKSNKNNKLKRGEIRDAQEKAKSYRYKLDTGCGTMWLIIVVDDDDNIIETFTESANGGCMIFTRATSRLISLSLRGGIKLDDVIDQLLSAGSCPAYQAARGKGKDVSPGASCAGAIALKLKEIKEKINHTDEIDIIEKTKEVKTDVEIKDEAKCPECGFKLEHEGGCSSCRNCGWSKCG